MAQTRSGGSRTHLIHQHRILSTSAQRHLMQRFACKLPTWCCRMETYSRSTTLPSTTLASSHGVTERSKRRKLKRRKQYLQVCSFIRMVSLVRYAGNPAAPTDSEEREHGTTGRRPSLHLARRGRRGRGHRACCTQEAPQDCAGTDARCEYLAVCLSTSFVGDCSYYYNLHYFITILSRAKYSYMS